MKAILEFNLPEEDDDFFSASQGGMYRAALYELNQRIRNEMKYNDAAWKDKDWYAAMEWVRGEIADLRTEFNLKE